jgi:hypothetical protein
MFYTAMLAALAFRAQSKGQNVWQTGVRDGTFFYPSEKFMGGTPPVVVQQPAVYQSYPPPAQQPIPMSVPHTYPAQV